LVIGSLNQHTWGYNKSSFPWGSFSLKELPFVPKGKTTWGYNKSSFPWGSFSLKELPFVPKGKTSWGNFSLSLVNLLPKDLP
jgi:hypothetical protein